MKGAAGGVRYGVGVVRFRRSIGVLSIAASALAATFAGACSGATGPTTSADPVLAKGQEIHNGRCASCHGINGEGGTGKKLNDGVVTSQLPSVAAHKKIVQDGISGTPMAAWKDILTPEEIDAVVRYQREVLDKIRS